MDQTVGTWILGIVLVLIQTALTTVLGLIIKKMWDKKEAEKKELEELREKERTAADNDRCTLMKDTVHKEIVDLEKRLTKQSTERYNELTNVCIDLKDDLGLVKNGLQKDLYIDLVHIHDDLQERFKRQGYITREDQRDFDSLYWTYHNLGQNGIADGMHSAIMSMPNNSKGE